MKEILIKNINKIHTTILGNQRIINNLKLDISIDLIMYLKQIILNENYIILSNNKNYYLEYLNQVFTINKSSYTVITAKLKKS